MIVDVLECEKLKNRSNIMYLIINRAYEVHFMQQHENIEKLYVNYVCL